MKYDLSKLQEPLPVSMVEFRVQSISVSGWARMLAYKDARVDMQRLDAVFGPLNWKREHSNGNANCTVSVWDDDKKQWVGKEDVGTESNTEAAKGLASDSFKRACTNLGIGRELYDYPVILVQLNQGEFEVYEDRGKKKARQTYGLNLKEWVWASEFDASGKIVALAAKDKSGKLRYKHGNFTSKGK